MLPYVPNRISDGTLFTDSAVTSSVNALPVKAFVTLVSFAVKAVRNPGQRPAQLAYPDPDDSPD
jgi:hypothetical protein